MIIAKMKSQSSSSKLPTRKRVLRLNDQNSNLKFGICQFESCLGFGAWKLGFLLVVLALAGCHGEGYRWDSTYRKGIHTVAVPIFTSKSYYRGAEFGVTEALIKALEANTPYKVVPKERADTILEGEILEVRLSTLSEDIHSAIPQEQLLALTVNFTWKDLRTGRILVSRRGWEQASTFYPTLGEGQFEGAQSATEKLALAIVHELEGDW